MTRPAHNCPLCQCLCAVHGCVHVRTASTPSECERNCAINNGLVSSQLAPSGAGESSTPFTCNWIIIAVSLNTDTQKCETSSLFTSAEVQYVLSYKMRLCLIQINLLMMINIETQVILLMVFSAFFFSSTYLIFLIF